MMISPRNWTKVEVLSALALYCQLPFGQMHARNPTIIDAANFMGRTPSSLALKLVNLASLDPTLKARGIRGMANTSRLDQEVWAEYFGKWDLIASALPEPIVAKLEDGSNQTYRESAFPEGPTEVQHMHMARRGQQFFRTAVLSAYENKCCITGIHVKSLLRASHIIPWSVATEHRLNPMNGLCLNALHDSAFDKGLLTLTESRKIQLSSKLLSVMPKSTFDQLFAIYDGKTITCAEKFLPLGDFIEYHRTTIFRP